MKDKFNSIISLLLDDYNVFIDDVFIDKNEGKEVLNVVVDSEEVIDLNKITDVSRIINKYIDDNLDIDVYEVDIYSKEKGDSSNEW